MGDELMPLQVPVDPRFCAAALRQSQHRAVEVAWRVEVVDGYGQMEPWDGGVEDGHPSKLSRLEEGADLAGGLLGLVEHDQHVGIVDVARHATGQVGQAVRMPIGRIDGLLELRGR